MTKRADEITAYATNHPAMGLVNHATQRGNVLEAIARNPYDPYHLDVRAALLARLIAYDFDNPAKVFS
jgi:hypothetical protein